MHSTLTRLVAALITTASLSASITAAAQEQPPQQPQVAPTPPVAIAPNGQFVAPLSQTTQSTYVPQSVAMSGPRTIEDYNEGDPIPHGYHTESRVRKGLLIGGGVTFGSLYLISALVAAAAADSAGYDYGTGQTVSRSNPDAALYVPVVGPFIQIASETSSTARLFLVIDGAGQALGAGMFVAGLASPKTVLVRNDLGSLRLTPMAMGARGSGVGLIGKF